MNNTADSLIGTTKVIRKSQQNILPTECWVFFAKYKMENEVCSKDLFYTIFRKKEFPLLPQKAFLLEDLLLILDSISQAMRSNLTHQYLFLLMILCSLSFLTQAQKKYEREVRIKEENVPIKALRFIDSLKFDKPVKWYKDYALEDTTIEAKTKYKHAIYSIEFELSGKIQDVEKTIDWKEIPTITQSIINDYWAKNHQKTSIQKIQIQYTGSKEALIYKLNKGENSSDLTTKYEIILNAKTNNERELIEYLFSENGAMEKRSVVVFKNTDNLEY